MALARPAPPPHAALILRPVPAPAAPQGYVHPSWNGNGHPYAWGQGWRNGYGGNRYGWNGNGWNGNGWNGNGWNGNGGRYGGQWTSAVGLGDGGYVSAPQDQAPQVNYYQPGSMIIVAPFAVPEGAPAMASAQGSSGPLIIYVNRDKSAAQPAGALPKIIYGDMAGRHASGPEIIYGDSGK